MAGVFDYFRYSGNTTKTTTGGGVGARRGSVKSRNSSIGGATYMHAPEYHGPSRKNSVGSVGSGGEGESTMVDLSKISHDEFEKLYHGMRKGEPSNRVNF